MFMFMSAQKFRFSEMICGFGRYTSDTILTKQWLNLLRHYGATIDGCHNLSLQFRRTPAFVQGTSTSHFLKSNDDPAV